MKITRTEHFDIQRKIVANMTTESWEQIPMWLMYMRRM